VEFDHDFRQRSFWLGRSRHEPATALAGDQRADMVILGGGLTGLWTALLLKQAEPALDVVLLEAQVVGYGASGRSAGFAMTTVGRNLRHLSRTFGREQAREIYRAMVDTLRHIEAFAREEGVQDIWRSGNLAVSTTPVQDRRIRSELEAIEALGLDDFELLEGEGLGSRIRARGLRLALFEPHCLLLDPFALVRGLLTAATRLGVRIFERSFVETLDASKGGGVIARTTQGSVRAERALVATNAYAHSIPELRRYLFTVYAYTLVTEPLLPVQWDRVGWESRCGAEDRRLVVHGYRRTPDGRILWCGRHAPIKIDGPHPRFDRDARVFDRLQESFFWTFPQLRGLGFDYAWGGPICGTLNCIATVRWLEEERILYALGYAGHGIGPSQLVARVARDLLLGRHSTLSALPFNSRKPVPLPPGRSLRRLCLGLAERLMEWADDDLAGRQGPVKRTVARLFE
jgi:glycine/D-amino acid oxidase-like deaminating enzyme